MEKYINAEHFENILQAKVEICRIGTDLENDYVKFLESTLKMLKLMPKSDVTPVVRGKWEYIGHVNGRDDLQCAVCSECGKITAIFSEDIDLKHAPVCCWCGAKMDLEEEK